ncbi:hypothetical protein JCM10212_005862 [Sporobolomyces blumeae]
MDPPPVPGPSSGRTVVAATDLTPFLIEPTNTDPSPLSGTQDLISLFRLDGLYNTFLRPYLPPPALGSSSDSATQLESPTQTPSEQAAGAVSIKGKEKATATPGVAPSAPLPPGQTASAPGSGGLKITLSGIKFGSSGLGNSLNASGPAGQAATNDAKDLAAANGKPKRLKMEKTYSHMVADILGRNKIKKDQFLTHLVLNPDPPPCPPLHPPDPQLLREGLTFKVGGLAGFDMSVWENGPEGANEAKKKKKKRKAEGPAGADGADKKKPRH